MISRSIFRSNKNVQGEGEGKKAQVRLASNHLLHLNDSPDKENSQRSASCKDFQCEGGSKKIEEKGERERVRSGGKGNSVLKSTTSIKGCLKRDFEDRKESFPDSEELEGKSCRSIKFNINPDDVFEYTHTDNRKKVKTLVKKIGSASRNSPPPITENDGECCEIF